MTEGTRQGLLATAAGRVAGVDRLPTAVRATLRFYARSGRLDLASLRLRGVVEDRIDAFVDDCFDTIETAIEQELEYTDVTFSYETKLTLPVELTLGYLYRRARAESPAEYDPITDTVSDSITAQFGVEPTDEERAQRLRAAGAPQRRLVADANRLARLGVEALLDGDMQDAINDDEYADFELDRSLTDAEREQVARVAQSCLNDRVEERFAAFDDSVRAEYDQAVAASQGHQAEDERFRDLFEAAQDGDPQAREAITDEYKHAPFETEPAVLTADEQDWPYCKTQYERVGVIYDGMIEIFRAAGIAIEEDFKRAVVLSIIGAQIWLDDVDDYAADMENGQLTPVTAEYLLCDSDEAAHENVVSITEQYLDGAIEYAIRSDSPMTGIATEYIYLSGDPEKLPNS